MIGAGVHLYVGMYIYISVCDTQKCLNGTLAVYLSFQTLVVDFSLKS